MYIRKFNKLFAALILSAFFLQVFGLTASGQLGKQRKLEATEQSDQTTPNEATPMVEKRKIAPDLEESVDGIVYGRQADKMQRVIIQLKSETPLNEMFGNARMFCDKPVKSGPNLTPIVGSSLPTL